MLLSGRRGIYTSILPVSMQWDGYSGETLNNTTLHIELNKALQIHNENVKAISYLMNYYKGKQDILERSEEDRRVNNKVVVNYAQSSTRDIVGYTFGKSIQYVQREHDFMQDVQKINSYMSSENKSTLDIVMANDQSICGTAYRGIFPDKTKQDETPFEILYFSPLTTFVVYSTYNIFKPVYACTYYDIKDLDNNITTIYQIYTNAEVYIYKVPNKLAVDISHLKPPTKNPLGKVPIVEYMNNQFRLGDWEFSVSLMNAINELASDSINDVEQTVLSYLVLFGVNLEEDDFKSMKENRVMSFEGLQGINQDAKFITAQIDGSSIQMLREYLEEAMRVVIGIPDRKTRGGGGGDTGDAVKLRDGWADIEVVARNKEMFTSMAEKEFLKVVLNILRSKNVISDNLTINDIDIKFSRNKTDNIQSKVQAGSTLYSMGIDKSDVAEAMDITTDVIGLINRWDKSEEDKQPKVGQKMQEDNTKVVTIGEEQPL